MNYVKYVSIILITIIFFNCNTEKNKMKEEYFNFLTKYYQKIKPLYKETNLAYFNATVTGNKEEYKNWEDKTLALTKIYTNKEEFELLKKVRAANILDDEKQKRELELIYLSYLGNQIDEKILEQIIKIQVDIEQKFSTFRAEVNGKSKTDNEIEDILSNSTDSKLLQSAWEGSKKIGLLVSDDIKKLVELRNKAAKELGFNNYHEMSLKLSEQEPEEISKLFDELDELTNKTYKELKAEIDKFLSAKYKIKEDELMPWHYQNRFFQEAPKIYSVDLDKYYKNADIVKLAAEYFNGIGTPINEIIQKSDLYEKPGKYQHAYCINIDREGDVRVVCNIKPNSKWMNTTLHEYGHAIYEKYMDIKSLPWTLRQPAHTFTTEAIAMLFGRLSSNPQWMSDMLKLSPEEKEKISETSIKILRLEQLVFSRWAQVMYRFEKSMYENPNQDLNQLWWDLVEKYQMVKKPPKRDNPDWATKIHIASYPCYYHNYLLGELLASQLNHYITKNILHSDNINEQSFYNNISVGKYLIENVFNPGALYKWNDMIKKATGEYLTPKYYAEQFINK